MITLTRVKQATNEFIKVLRFGRSDVQTAKQIAPFGIDSKPINNTLALHIKTSEKGEGVVIGYMNTNNNTNEGELRLYATDSAGVEVFSMYFKNNGTVEFGGSTDNLVRYAALNTALQSELTALNARISALYTALGITPYVPVTLDISFAKINEIKSS